MGLLEFNKLPINTLVGADWKTFKAITAGREIDAAYKGKYRLTKAVCRLLSPLAGLQNSRYEKLLANQPLVRCQRPQRINAPQAERQCGN